MSRYKRPLCSGPYRDTGIFTPHFHFIQAVGVRLKPNVNPPILYKTMPADDIQPRSASRLRVTAITAAAA